MDMDNQPSIPIPGKNFHIRSFFWHHGQSIKLIKPEVIEDVKNWIVYHYIQISTIPSPYLYQKFLAPIRGWLGWRRVTRSRELRTWQLVRKSWTLARGVPDPLFFFISRTGKTMPWVQTVDHSTRWWWESKIRFAKKRSPKPLKTPEGVLSPSCHVQSNVSIASCCSIFSGSSKPWVKIDHLKKNLWQHE